MASDDDGTILYLGDDGTIHLYKPKTGIDKTISVVSGTTPIKVAININTNAVDPAVTLNTELSAVSISSPPTVTNITSISTILAKNDYSSVTSATDAKTTLIAKIGTLFTNRASATETTYLQSLSTLITAAIAKTWVGSDSTLTGYNSTLTPEIIAATLNTALTNVTIATPPTVANITSISNILSSATWACCSYRISMDYAVKFELYVTE